ncbi:MAG: YceD family protein [Nocardioidaceae bacterium]
MPAPAGVGIDVLGVLEGSLVELDLRLEAVMEGVLVTGTATVQVSGECARCLGRIANDLAVDLQELYAYDVGRDDDETGRLEGDLLDLEPVLRDAVVLALPFSPRCSPDCPGLCPQCGARLADDPDHVHDERMDPRWAALSRLTGDQDDRPVNAGLDEE